MFNRVYKFHNFVLDTYKKQLIYEEETINISFKAYEILLVLIKNSGTIVKKETLLSEIWNDSFVEESNLPVYISNLRKIFRKKVAGEDFIKTVSGRGYVFIKDIEIFDAPYNPKPAPKDQKGSSDDIDLSEYSTNEPDAVNLYIKGIFIYDTINTRMKIEEDLYQAIKFFDSAIVIDSNFIDAYIGIGKALLSLETYGYIRRDEAYKKCKSILQRVRSIDPQDSNVLFFAAESTHYFELEIHKSIRLLKKVIEHGKKQAEAHNRLGLCYICLSDFEAAEFHYNAASQLEPTNIKYRGARIRVPYYSGDFNQAIIRANEVLEMDSRSFIALFLLSGCYAELGVFDEALRYNAETLKVFDVIEVRFKRVYILALMGKNEEANKLVAEVLLDDKKLQQNLLAIVAVYSVQNKIDEAFDLLFKHYRETNSSILSIEGDPRMNNLRNDKRFQIFLKKLNLR